MKRFFSIAIFLVVFSNFCICQYRYREAIDSLKGKLSAARDTGRIKCLNDLSTAYYPINSDTSQMFASAAYSEAIEKNDTNGKADALANMGQIKQEYGDLPEAESYFRKAVEIVRKEIHVKQWIKMNSKFAYCKLLQGKYEESRVLLEENLNLCKDEPELSKVYIYRNLGSIYDYQGYYEKALEYFRKDMQLSQQSTDAKSNRRSLFMWGNYYWANLYKDAGDTKTALYYFTLSAQRAKENDLDDYYNTTMGNICFMTGKYDSARYYYNQTIFFVKRRIVSAIQHNFLVPPTIKVGETYLMQKDYRGALQHFIEPLHFLLAGNNRPGAMMLLLDIARAYEGQQKFELALENVKHSIEIAENIGARQFICDGYDFYSRIYDRLNETDSAYKYLKKSVAMKDILARDKQMRNMTLLEMKAQGIQHQLQVDLLSRDNEIKRQELQKESVQKRILVAAIVFLLLTAFIVIRNVSLKQKNEKLHNEQKQAELMHKATGLEMQALRAQMNPHFIFNCLSSINRFILKNESEAASDYLTKFSRLIRMVLTNSGKAFITLEDELEMLRLYLEMERLRFKYAFDYNIVFKNEMDCDDIFIPPLLLQPFAENAIWHGLMNKESHGLLLILLNKENNFLNCIIEDNGVGRAKAIELNSKSVERNKSMGLQITKERLALLNKETNESTNFEIQDLFNDKGKPSGTRIVLKIKLAEKQQGNMMIS